MDEGGGGGGVEDKKQQTFPFNIFIVALSSPTAQSCERSLVFSQNPGQTGRGEGGGGLEGEAVFPELLSTENNRNHKCFRGV